MKTTKYDFYLPEGLIAERPSNRRDESRLLVLHRDGETEHRKFAELPRFLQAGDMLILNKTKVFPARIEGRKRGGGKIAILLVRETLPGTWEILTKGRYSGPLVISDEVAVEIRDGKTATFSDARAVNGFIWRQGMMPLPPYIRRRPDELDKERYQTVYAETEGSIAAPTAGLHFTRELLEEISSKSVLIRHVILHVGTGTFKPVKAEDIEDHCMDSEFFEFDPLIFPEMQEVKARGNRIVAVGTTTTRAVEGYLSGKAEITSRNGAIRGTTDIFVRDGFKPQAIDSLITNFHLPRSTPLMLTAVFAGREKLLRAYQSAISRGYRFFSYGDAMLVL